MKENERQKHQRYQNQSLMALATSNHSEPTKKIIEPEQLYSNQPIAHANSRVYMFRLPIGTEISALVTALTTKFASSIIHAEEDEIGAQMILEGLQCPDLRGKLAKLFDHFVFCCSKGLRFGKLEETYNVILLTIRKQVIDNHCVITVTNPYSHLTKTSLTEIFVHKILEPIQQQLKNILKLEKRQIHQHSYVNPILNDNSPTRIDIYIHKKIYDLFVLPDNKEYSRFKGVFLHSLEKISEEIDKYRHKMSSSTVLSAKRATSPSVITECFIMQSEALLQSLKNSYKEEEDHHDMDYLHKLLCSQTAETISLYTIEEAICIHQLANLKDIYQASKMEQCEAFNKNVQYLNNHKTDDECFQHLTLKKKYRLPNQQKPYFSAIQRLQMIEHCTSLREALLVIQQTFSDVKTDCFVSHKGKAELSSMDELLPVIIFVTVRAAVRNFPVWIQIMGDYVRIRSVFELQERIMTAFYAAIEDISRGWQEDEKV